MGTHRMSYDVPVRPRGRARPWSSFFPGREVRALLEFSTNCAPCPFLPVIQKFKKSGRLSAPNISNSIKLDFWVVAVRLLQIKRQDFETGEVREEGHF